MADDAQKDGAPPLPPKLDLRKSGVLKDKPTTEVAPIAPVAAKPVIPVPAPKPVAAVRPVAPRPVATVSPVVPKPIAEIKPPEAEATKPVVPQPAPKPVATVQPSKAPEQPAAKTQEIDTPEATPKPVATVQPMAPKPVAEIKPLATETQEVATPTQPAPAAPKPAIPTPAPRPTVATITPVDPKPVAAVQPMAPKPVAEIKPLATETQEVATPAQPAPAAPRPTVIAKPIAPRPTVAAIKTPAQPASTEVDDPSQTMRIILDAKPATGAPTLVAPKPVPRPTVKAQPVAPKPAAPRPVASKTIVRPTNLDSAKKETSKIPLNAAKATPASDATLAADAQRTIRIKPTASAAQNAPGISPVAATPVTVAAGENDKNKTSRISLESAMTADSAPAPTAGTAPKTIRLKKPSEAATVRVATAPDKTSIIDEAAEEPVSTPTRKKTIKVKRPSQRTAIKKGGIKIASSGNETGVAAEGAEPGQAVADALVAAEAPDKPNVTFHIFAFAAIFVAIATIVVFCSQALGPNSCLTQYSWWKEGPNIGLPGKISMSSRY